MNSAFKEPARILAIDYGSKRIGLAISDPLQIFPIPLVTLSNDSKFWKEFNVILQKYNIEKIILGYPLKEDGSKSDATDEVEGFHIILSKKVSLPIVLIDERYSSAIAWEQIVNTVPSRKKRRDKSLIDRNAAAVLLNDYLISKKSDA
jgi:putative Holliday junction resolvase